MATKPKKFKKEHFEIVKNFLLSYGKEVQNKNFITCFSYKGETISLVLGEFLNGNGFYIESQTLLIIHYIKPNKIVKKRGFYKELEQYANNLEKIQEIKSLIHKKTG